MMDSGRDFYACLGGAHSGGLWLATYCDGHSGSLSYDMSSVVASQLANREGG